MDQTTLKDNWSHNSVLGKNKEVINFINMMLAFEK